LWVVLAGALAGPALAQKAEQPAVSVGDQWQFVMYFAVPSTSPNRVWLIDSVGPTGIEGTENGQPLRLTPDLNVVESPRQTDSNPRQLRFPLEVGDRWSYTTDYLLKYKDGSKGSALINVAVVGYEKVSVPAGEFEAFKLEAKGIVRGVSPLGSQIEGDITWTYWYAPAARAIVRSVSRNPYLGTSTVDLVEFQLRPEGANCQLKFPPATAGESSNHGVTLKIFPRRKDVTASYTGCQILWAPHEGEWKEVSVTAIESGYAVRLWSAHLPDQEAYRCRYLEATLVRGEPRVCPDPQALIVRSMAPGCAAKIREQGAAADGCHFE
jgi:hypothetical protein